MGADRPIGNDRSPDGPVGSDSSADRPIGSDRSADGPIGVFDSGVGGLSILKSLRAELPHEDFVYFADTAHAPYGERSDAYVVARSLAIARELVEGHGAKALVVACNTATAAAVHLLRAAHPQVPVVGVEPALKPAAALTRTGHVAVFATRGTLASAKFSALHTSLRHTARFALVPCDGLAAAIEAGDATKTIALCAQYVRLAGRFGLQAGEIDTLVLGCTHYPFAGEHLRRELGPSVNFVDTGAPVARQTARLLQQAGQLRQAGPGGDLLLRSSGDRTALSAMAARWLPTAGPDSPEPQEP